MAEIDFGKALNENRRKSKTAVRNKAAVFHEKPVYDLEKVKNNFNGFILQVDQVHSAVSQFEVKTEGDAEQFVETLGVAAQLKKAFDAERKSHIKEADQFVRSVNAFVRKYVQQLDKIIAIGKRKVGDYRMQQELKRREEEKRIQEELAARQKKIDEAAKKSGIESVTLPPLKLPKKPEPIRSDSASASTRFKKVAIVEDFAKLPDKYKMVDEKALQRAVDAGLIPPGCAIKEQPITSIRS
jgi:hypothetical protein